MVKPKAKQILYVRLDEDIYSWIRTKSDEDNVSLTDVITNLVINEREKEESHEN